MAKEQPAKPAAEEQATAKKGLPIKTIGIVAGLLLAEAAGMYFILGATGKPTTLSETVFSTIPGSPVYAAKASQYRRDGSAHGIPSVALGGHNALQGRFRFAA